LTQRARTLYPPTPERLPDLEQWLGEALAILDRHAAGDPAASVPRFASGTSPELGALRDALVAFREPKHGPLAEVERRFEAARTLERRTLVEPERDWQRACAAIADPAGPYGGLVIRPQLGLVPLGPDPVSGLWEFGHWGASGDIPTRDDLGLLRFGEECGIVFVLLPGANYVQGGVPADLAEDPHENHEGPPREVLLAPFFLSKYEMTQGQWLRVMGSNPSQHEVGTSFAGFTTTALHPVEFLCWIDAEEGMQRLDLALPTEAQWEYAARAGTETTFWTGETPETLVCAASTMHHVRLGDAFSVLLHDPWEVHAPVGSFRPNPFGLHDMLGNVKEWCLDPWFGDYHERPLRPGDGLVVGNGDGHFAIRGGSWGEGLNECRSAFRTDGRDLWRQPWIGVRPARGLR
jgi:formylglycine-generating enzyme required for sulfatase activity